MGSGGWGEGKRVRRAGSGAHLEGSGVRREVPDVRRIRPGVRREGAGVPRKTSGARRVSPGRPGMGSGVRPRDWGRPRSGCAGRRTPGSFWSGRWGQKDCSGRKVAALIFLSGPSLRRGWPRRPAAAWRKLGLQCDSARGRQCEGTTVRFLIRQNSLLTKIARRRGRKARPNRKNVTGLSASQFLAGPMCGIPMRCRPPAQGFEERATLGKRSTR